MSETPREDRATTVCECGHDQGSHNGLRFNCLATRDGHHATRCECWTFTPKQEPSMPMPRRINIDKQTPAETAISAAIQAVESAGADVLLTEAVMLLGQAQAKVADYVDAQIASTHAR